MTAPADTLVQYSAGNVLSYALNLMFQSYLKVFHSLLSWLVLQLVVITEHLDNMGTNVFITKMCIHIRF